MNGGGIADDDLNGDGDDLNGDGDDDDDLNGDGDADDDGGDGDGLNGDGDDEGLNGSADDEGFFFDEDDDAPAPRTTPRETAGHAPKATQQRTIARWTRDVMQLRAPSLASIAFAPYTATSRSQQKCWQLCVRTSYAPSRYQPDSSSTYLTMSPARTVPSKAVGPNSATVGSPWMIRAAISSTDSTHMFTHPLSSLLYSTRRPRPSTT